MKCKCKITCVKVWMCLAVCGCLITLILAGIVLSSYDFDTVIGPLSCKLRNIKISRCCYDDDCIYGHEYRYYFSSNSTHCMNKFDIYEHPTNKTVRFIHESSCYPSIKSLKHSTPNWYINDSVIFYVNKECTEWIESSVHTESVNTNLLWITIILSFVGCSCISMICGFITMYHIEIITCFIDYCSCCCCCICCNINDDDDGENDSDDTDIHHKNIANNNDNNSSSSSSSGDGYKYHPKQHQNIAPSIQIHGDQNGMNGINGNTLHLSVQHAVHRHHNINRQNSNNSSYKEMQNNNNNNPNNKYNVRPRGPSNASNLSKLSPLSSNPDADIQNFGFQRRIKQFVVDEGDEKIHKKKSQNMKYKIYDNKNNINNRNNDELEEMIDEIASNGMSDSVYFENEWYDENEQKSLKDIPSKRKYKKKISDIDHDRKHRKKRKKKKKITGSTSNDEEEQYQNQQQQENHDDDDDDDDDEYYE